MEFLNFLYLRDAAQVYRITLAKHSHTYLSNTYFLLLLGESVIPCLHVITTNELLLIIAQGIFLKLCLHRTNHDYYA